MSDVLKKRWTLPAGVITHIFDGEPSGNSFAGFHSEAIKSRANGKVEIDGQPNPEQLQRWQDGKTYKLKVKIKLGNGGGFCQTAGVSTFFPDPAKPKGKDWSKENIIRWIEQALTNPDDSARSSREEWTETPRSIRTTGLVGAQDLKSIRVNGVRCHVIYTAGKIASIYPANLDDADPSTR